jgi:holo-[acyl-carrier protein] synthase
MGVAGQNQQRAGAILGIGTDVVEISRLERSLKSERFVEEIFGDRERAYCSARARPAQHFAARFAAKEAFLKALGRGVFSGIALRDIEVVREGDGPPALSLGPSAARALAESGARSALVTLTHAGDIASAVVLVQ